MNPARRILSGVFILLVALPPLMARASPPPDPTVEPTLKTNSTVLVGPRGWRGERGFLGLTGRQGIQGRTGLQGEQGIQGTVGLTGPQGVQGDTGPQGPQGPQGPTGPTGPRGEPAGTLASICVSNNNSVSFGACTNKGTTYTIRVNG